MSLSHGRILAAGLLVFSVAVTSGCLSKKLFRNTVQEQDEKISDLQTGVESNERRVGDLKEETRREVARLDAKAEEARRNADEALSRAENAEWLARGKVLWEVTLTNDQVKFGFDESEIPLSATGALDDVAMRVKDLGRTVYLEIEGHTDSIGTPGYNESLGLRRAEAVRRYLNESGGIPLHLMSVISYGETKPVADNAARDGRAQNRRVVIRVLE
jgi:outer membrane protein OmpA-like peptidoglycan-associated protein